jgi:hypothetical protein
METEVEDLVQVEAVGAHQSVGQVPPQELRLQHPLPGIADVAERKRHPQSKRSTLNSDYSLT